MRPGRALVVLHGIWSGWLLALLVSHTGLIAFRPADPASAPVLSYCVRTGYPKHRDYFWYAAMVVAGLAGGAAARLLLRRFASEPPARAGRRLALPLGLGAGAAATVLAFSAVPAFRLTAWPLALVAILLPWRDQRWRTPAPSPPAPPPPDVPTRKLAMWGLASLLVAAAWLYDPCIRFREVDLMHEGAHLLYAQSWLSGERIPFKVRSEYGPLYTLSVIGWLRTFGMTVECERWYFYTAQVAGSALNLFLVFLVCRGAVARAAGVMLVLFTTTAAFASYFGWANALRSSLPLAALVFSWRGAVAGAAAWPAVAGILAAFGVLYAPEYGIPGAGACAILLSLAPNRGRNLASWGAAFAAAGLALFTAMFGREAPRALALIVSDSYIATRLAGHYSWPFHPVSWWDSALSARELVRTLPILATIWLPGLLCVAGAALMSGRPAGTAGLIAPFLAALGLVFEAPILVRPWAQIALSIPPAILLAAVALERSWRMGAGVRAAGLALAGFVILAFPAADTYVGSDNPLSRLRCPARKAAVRLPELPRLGGLELPADQAAFLRDAVRGMRRLCPPGKRYLLADTTNNVIGFLADRTALAPYPQTGIAATPVQRQAVLAALERTRPPLVVYNLYGWDVAFPYAYPEIWSYVERNYRMAGRVTLTRTLNYLQFWVPKDLAGEK